MGKAGRGRELQSAETDQSTSAVVRYVSLAGGLLPQHTAPRTKQSNIQVSQVRDIVQKLQYIFLQTARGI